MGLGFKTELENNELLGEFDPVWVDVLGKSVKVDYFSNEGLILLVEMSLDLFLELDEEVDKF